jgi:hypothetical protein
MEKQTNTEQARFVELYLMSDLITEAQRNFNVLHKLTNSLPEYNALTRDKICVNRQCTSHASFTRRVRAYESIAFVRKTAQLSLRHSRIK